MPTTGPTTTPATRTNGRKVVPPPTPADRPPRLVENVTRVTVAFPFATIRTADADVVGTVEELAELVAALAAEVDARRATPETAELAERARTLATKAAAS